MSNLYDPEIWSFNPRRAADLMEKDIPEIGTKISLLSITENRYEGVLLMLDVKSCTIAVGAVRLFGTEHRATLYPVAPLMEIINYLVFQAQIIKDIRMITSFTALSCGPGNLFSQYLPRETPNAQQQMQHHQQTQQYQHHQLQQQQQQMQYQHHQIQHHAQMQPHQQLVQQSIWGSQGEMMNVPIQMCILPAPPPPIPMPPGQPGMQPGMPMPQVNSISQKPRTPKAMLEYGVFMPPIGKMPVVWIPQQQTPQLAQTNQAHQLHQQQIQQFHQHHQPQMIQQQELQHGPQNRAHGLQNVPQHESQQEPQHGPQQGPYHEPHQRPSHVPRHGFMQGPLHRRQQGLRHSLQMPQAFQIKQMNQMLQDAQISQMFQEHQQSQVPLLSHSPKKTQKNQVSDKNSHLSLMQQQPMSLTQVFQGILLKFPLFGIDNAEKPVGTAEPKSPNKSTMSQMSRVSDECQIKPEQKALGAFSFFCPGPNIAGNETENRTVAATYQPMTASLHGAYTKHKVPIRAYPAHPGACSTGRANYANVVRYRPVLAAASATFDMCNTNGLNDFQTDYNFVKANKEFERLLLDEAAGGVSMGESKEKQKVQDKHSGGYNNQKSFFDNISYEECDKGKENVNVDREKTDGAWQKVSIGAGPRKGYLANRPNSNYKNRGQLRTFNKQSYSTLAQLNEDN